VLRQIVGDLEPWRLVCNKDMPLRAQSRIGVERSQCQANAALGVSGRPIDDRRAADPAKAAPETRVRIRSKS
jgi:hypothetical protein